MLYPVLGVFKGRRITVHDVVMYSRAQHAIRRRRALAFVVAQLAASESSSRANRVVPRALGKWRGSSLAGYVFRGDEKTYKEKFRMPKAMIICATGVAKDHGGPRSVTSAPRGRLDGY